MKFTSILSSLASALVAATSASGLGLGAGLGAGLLGNKIKIYWLKIIILFKPKYFDLIYMSIKNEIQSMRL